MSLHQVEKHMSYEILFKALLFAVVKMASFPGCMTFIPQNLGNWGGKGQQSCHQMGTCTHWRKQPTGSSWKSMIQCWALHMGRQNMQKYSPPTLRCIESSTVSGWREISTLYFYSETHWSPAVRPVQPQDENFLGGWPKQETVLLKRLLRRWSQDPPNSAWQEDKKMNTNSNSRG